MMVKAALTARIREALKDSNLSATSREALAESAILLEVAVESESKLWDMVPALLARFVPSREAGSSLGGSLPDLGDVCNHNVEGVSLLHAILERMRETGADTPAKLFAACQGMGLEPEVCARVVSYASCEVCNDEKH